MEKEVGGWTQLSTRGCFSSFYLDWDWDRVSALGTAPVKTHRNRHGSLFHTHIHTQPTRSGGKSKGCLNSTETLQRLSESSCLEQWPRGRITHWLQHTHRQTPNTLLGSWAPTQMHTNTHKVLQMWKLWPTGKRSYKQIENRARAHGTAWRDNRVISAWHDGLERQGRETGQRQKVEKKRTP